MLSVRLSLPVLLLAAPAAAQQVADCGEAPPVSALVEPWEETSLAFAEGAVRLALLHGEGEEGERLLVLTLPPLAELEEAVAEAPPGPLPPPERRCRIVTEGDLGFALLDVAGAEVVEGAGAATLAARIPALRFIPESTELEELTLVLTFGLEDDSLAAAVEVPEVALDEGEPVEGAGAETGEEPAPEADPEDAATGENRAAP